jgi:hypothetical protein
MALLSLRRVVGVVLPVVLPVTLLTACGGSSGSGTPTAPATTPAASSPTATPTGATPSALSVSGKTVSFTSLGYNYEAQVVSPIGTAVQIDSPYLTSPASAPAGQGSRL